MLCDVILVGDRKHVVQIYSFWGRHLFWRAFWANEITACLGAAIGLDFISEPGALEK